jgi:hypothetical protein
MSLSMPGLGNRIGFDLVWVNRVGLTARRSLPVFPDQRTLPTGSVGPESANNELTNGLQLLHTIVSDKYLT